MQIQNYPTYLDKNLVIQKLSSLIPGITIGSPQEVIPGFRGDAYIHDLIIPGHSYKLPLMIYNKGFIIRNSFFTICNRLELNIKDFDRDCPYRQSIQGTIIPT